MKHMDRIEEIWRERVRERRKQLAELKEANRKASEENRKHYDDEIEAVNELFSFGQRTEGESRRFVSFNAIAIVSSLFKRCKDSKTTNDVLQHGER